MTERLTQLEVAVLRALAARAEPVAVEALARELGVDQSPVAGALALLAAPERGLVELGESPATQEGDLGPRAQEWGEDGASPDRRVARALAALGGEASLQDLAARGGLEPKHVGESLKPLAARRWASKHGATLRLGPGWQAPEPPPQPDELLVGELKRAGRAPHDELVRRFGQAAIDLLTTQYRQVYAVRDRRTRRAALTEAGRRLASGALEGREEVNALTTELIVSGRWREVEFRPYDITLPGPRLTPGKEHPFRRILQATRRVFLEMGFEETASPWVESAFWDFDALFQPQDHPARDMQDTFYVGRPARCALPDDALVRTVARTHENGGDTGSVGWRTRWSRELAERCVLRTHTTAATIRALAQDPRPPRKVFTVGPVFRRESIDYKHLPVFHQVDGIVIDEKASFAALLGVLRAFYEKMGFERIQFRPGFFPYTEPSVEVFVWMESRRDWIEMGGSGVFRPEVVEPLGCRVPVLAWGLGLERVAMLRYGLSDIRELYLAHLDWLKEAPLCRS
ncbi:MAG: phenylalanine--tRNA ligase subunit alpha [Acidobacteria bacterium]|nr:phenylalanine--tRNA ligase subunit alpha [Acidobacteriota bacterium]